MATLAACGAGNNFSSTPDGSSINGRDAVAEMHIENPSCKTAGSICIGNRVSQCVDKHAGELEPPCPFSCSLGRCTTDACNQAEHAGGVLGCRFYGVQSDNIDTDDGRNMMLILSNGADQPVDAVVEARLPDGTWAPLAAASVPPFAGKRIELNRPVPMAGVTAAAAFRIETSGPVMAVQIVSDDADRKSRSSAGTVLRPVQALGLRHVAVTAPARSSDAVWTTPGSRDGAGTITIVATSPNTHVEVKLTGPVLMQSGGLLDVPPLDVLAPVAPVAPMDEGDVLQIFSTGAETDLTGTIITSDVPVAVFSGNVFTSYGYDLSGFNGGDLAQEQLPPTASWGFEYVGARLSPQIGCDSFFGNGVGLWGVIASDDNTTVNIYPAPHVSVDWPGLSADLPVTLSAGQMQTFWTRGNLKPLADADVVVHANKPILLAQWLDCEPGLAWGIDTGLQRGSMWLTLPPGFDHELVVVKRIGTSVEFDYGPLDEGRFTPASVNGDYQVARIRSDSFKSCHGPLDPCDHHLSGGAFGVSWRGMDVVCSYALTVPSGELCSLPNVDCTP